jgi:hypothetical protein
VDSSKEALPFERIIEGLLKPEMMVETVSSVRTAIQRGVLVNLIINNRAGGNAPVIAPQIARAMLPESEPKTVHRLNLREP